MTKKTCLFSWPWLLRYLLACCLGLACLQSASAQDVGAQSAFQEAQKIMQSLQQEGYTVEWVYIDVIDSLKQVQRDLPVAREYGLFVLSDEAILRIEVDILQKQEGQWKPYHRANSEDKNFVFATLMQAAPQSYRIDVRILEKRLRLRQGYFMLILFHE
jgi:hypothetical protein